MPLLGIGIALSLILVIVEKCKREGNRIDENGVCFSCMYYLILFISLV